MCVPFGGEGFSIMGLGVALYQQGAAPERACNHRQVITKEKGKGAKERGNLPTEMEVKESGRKTLQRTTFLSRKVCCTEAGKRTRLASLTPCRILRVCIRQPAAGILLNLPQVGWVRPST